MILSSLIITEKPSTAQSIGKALGGVKRREGYLEAGGYLISWCVGHLVELAPPGSYDERFQVAVTALYAAQGFPDGLGSRGLLGDDELGQKITLPSRFWC